MGWISSLRHNVQRVSGDQPSSCPTATCAPSSGLKHPKQNSHTATVWYTEWFKTLEQNLGWLLGRSFGAENINEVYFRFATVSELRRFTLVSLSLLRLSTFTIETIHFNISCQLILLFAMKEIKQILPIVAFFNRQFRVLLFGYTSVHVLGTSQTCYRYYRPSLITALQLSVLLQTFSAEPPSNDYNNTKGHQCKNVATRKVANMKNVIHIFFSKWSPQQPPQVLYWSFESPCIIFVLSVYPNNQRTLYSGIQNSMWWEAEPVYAVVWWFFVYFRIHNMKTAKENVGVCFQTIDWVSYVVCLPPNWLDLRHSNNCRRELGHH
jgi:hypothetical protein